MRSCRKLDTSPREQQAMHYGERTVFLPQPPTFALSLVYCKCELCRRVRLCYNARLVLARRSRHRLYSATLRPSSYWEQVGDGLVQDDDSLRTCQRGRSRAETVTRLTALLLSSRFRSPSLHPWTVMHSRHAKGQRPCRRYGRHRCVWGVSLACGDVLWAAV